MHKVNQIQQNYGELLTQIEKGVEVLAENRNPNDDFTPFINKIINLDERKAAFILRWLLDPKGSHGYSDFFLRRFLNFLNFPNIANKTKSDLRRVREEAYFALPLAIAPKNKNGYINNKGLIDILIEGKDFILGIETKFDAIDDENQLEKYLKYLKTINPQDYYLVYLKSGGELPENSVDQKLQEQERDHLRSISWGDVIGFLKNSQDKLENKISIFIENYCNALELKWRFGIMAQPESNKDLIDFLVNESTPEQMELAININNSYNAIVEGLLRKWLENLKAKLETGLSDIGVKREIETLVSYKAEYYKKPEMDYLAVRYPEWDLGVYILQTKVDKAFTTFNSNRASYGIFFLKKPEKENWNDPWINFLKEKINTEDLNKPDPTPVVDAKPLGFTSNSDFFAELRKNPDYLFDKIKADCERIEMWRREFEEQKNS